MGSGSFSYSTSINRIASRGYRTLSNTEIFTQKSINNAMNPYGLKVRESRDSEEHPNSLAIVIALDVTGSMGTVPHSLISNGLPEIMNSIITNGIKDPQVLFLGVGDHECDSSPLQVSQFESSDELLDKWLKDLYLEGGGGGNEGESYLLAWYLAGFHTSIDCLEKRKQKGYLFTIGDEPTLKSIPISNLEKIMGKNEYQVKKYSAEELLAKASEKYNVYHLHIKETNAGRIRETMDGWKQILQNNLIIIDRHEDVAEVISEIVCKSSADSNNNDKTIPEKEEEIML